MLLRKLKPTLQLAEPKPDKELIEGLMNHPSDPYRGTTRSSEGQQLESTIKLKIQNQEVQLQENNKKIVAIGIKRSDNEINLAVSMVATLVVASIGHFIVGVANPVIVITATALILSAAYSHLRLRQLDRARDETKKENTKLLTSNNALDAALKGNLLESHEATKE